MRDPFFVGRALFYFKGVIHMASTSNKIIQVLLKEARCTECDCSYQSEDVYVLRQRAENVWDLAAVCNACYTMSLIRAIVQGGKLLDKQGEERPQDAETIELFSKSGLSREERRRFAAMSPIGEEEVEAASKFLSDFDGDFERLFGQKKD